MTASVDPMGHSRAKMAKHFMYSLLQAGIAYVLPKMGSHWGGSCLKLRQSLKWLILKVIYRAGPPRPFFKWYFGDPSMCSPKWINILKSKKISCKLWLPPCDRTTFIISSTCPSHTFLLPGWLLYAFEPVIPHLEHFLLLLLLASHNSFLRLCWVPELCQIWAF